MPSQTLSPVKAFLFSLRFVAANPGAILRRAAIPSVLIVVAFYLLLSGYLQQVSAYLAAPGGGAASRVLGTAALGVLIMLFLHSQLVGGVTSLLLKGRPGSFMGIRSHEWRLFVSSLQLLLIICAYACVFWPANMLADRLALPPLGRAALMLALGAVLFWIVARAWFFLLPLCVRAPEGEMLPRSWSASAGHFWKISALLLLLAFVVGLFHMALQFLIWYSAAVPPLPSPLSIGAALDMHRTLLWPFVLLMSGTYLPAAIITTVARVRLYQELIGAAPDEG
jgi:hypothetical protein